MSRRGIGGAVVVLLAMSPAAPASAQSFQAADSIIESGIARGIYPGAVLVVGLAQRVLHRRGYGHLTWSANSPVPDPGATLWDLASLTKVVATTSSLMRLVERGQIELDAPVGRYLPRFRGASKDRVTVRMLLDHTSGLPAYREYFREAATRDSAVALLYATPLKATPGSATVYGDPNFMLLGLVVEAVGGQPLDTFAAREVFAPAGMTRTRFRPDRAPDRTAPTGLWRGTPICCEVNDQNAVRLGGVAGHAGAFGTADDLARYLRLWLAGGTLEGRQVFQAETVRRFLTPGEGEDARYLGWERPPRRGRDDSAYGRLASPSSFGHTGWTGVFIWADPERELYVVFLTNRSYAPKAGQSIRRLRALRGALSDALVAEVDRPAGPR